ncbi:hypothetical protein A8F94_16805 [Bacillus sp. FJAT-27225]|uniref:hypothetical protein n=1 Tax=Bacillus sp. FJAT-27225 TaxID=1743144 RepID=UPI00080C2490|nr:hypothetical protein [Bacillus sp. FJAT-27225]OCA84363.1 hypothetical protein A8F94_16805 [Bacillus sp. FJAT-27225]
MFKTRSSFFLFLFASLAHALTLIYFVASTVSTGLDGSHRESLLDWFPFLLFAATFAFHGLPELRAVWKSAPLRAFLLLIVIIGVLSWLLTAVMGIRF